MSSILFYLGLLSFSFASPSQPSKTIDKLGPVEVSKEFPTFGTYDLSGNYISFKSLQKQNKVMVVSYFATWCKPCRIGLPIIEKVAQNDPNTVAVYIDLGEEPATVKQMAKELGLNSTIMIDKFQSIGTRHGVVIEGEDVVLPRTFVLAPDGTVKVIFTEEGEDFEGALLNAITLASGQAPAQPAPSDKE